MKNSQNGRGAQRLWRGLTAVTASVLALALSAQPLVNASRTDIDKFLGTQSSKTVTDDTGEKQDLFTYKSDYAGTGELLNAIEDLGERMSEEGTVLLKNNGALPLSAGEKGKVSLLGFSSYYPVRGGIMGSSFIANQGTDADTVDLVQALTAKGFTLNPDLQPLYQGLESGIHPESRPPAPVPGPGVRLHHRGAELGRHHHLHHHHRPQHRWGVLQQGALPGRAERGKRQLEGWAVQL